MQFLLQLDFNLNIQDMLGTPPRVGGTCKGERVWAIDLTVVEMLPMGRKSLSRPGSTKGTVQNPRGHVCQCHHEQYLTVAACVCSDR